ncbi:MAG: glycerol kinase GlpK [Clostridiales bacterium]|jgi:glycerol kinase|nr:glycerol kinase GlpK [Clostridiales bacterium]
MKAILALDQGTTSSRAILFDGAGSILSKAQYEYPRIFPQPGWVEQNPFELFQSQCRAAAEAMEISGLKSGDIAAVGITNQRETTIVWDAKTGIPISNAIVWQCRRTAAICDELKAEGLEETVREKTGLLIDAYFSGTKIKWILDNVPGARERAENGELLFGNVDSWLIWNLTGGTAHVTDYSNASRTMLFNIHTLEWDKELCLRLGVPLAMLPKPMPSSCVYGTVAGGIPGLEMLQGVPIASAVGDQTSALFGQACFEPGMMKNTYGTGCFFLMNTGEKPVRSRCNLVSSVAWGINDKVEYALEGSVFNAGSVINWLRDGLGIIKNPHECDILAESVNDAGGVYFVPAFTGLGAPYWDMYSRGTIFGLTAAVGREHIARAVLESIAFQTKDLIDAAVCDVPFLCGALRVDGGASVSDIMMQFQADILGMEVDRPQNVESTALGAAYLAGLAVEIWKNTDEIRGYRKTDRLFKPNMEKTRREGLYRDWKRAVERSKGWAEY